VWIAAACGHLSGRRSHYPGHALVQLHFTYPTHAHRQGLQRCNERFGGFEAAQPLCLSFDPGKVAEDIPNRFNALTEGLKPVPELSIPTP
jgi:hypothetical protein